MDQKPFGNEALAAYPLLMMAKPLVALAAIFVTCSCATAEGGDPVGRLVAERQSLNGQQVQAEGTFSARHGVANVYSRDRRQCIGLLTHTVPAWDLAAFEGRTVRVAGRLMAAGCPKGGTCNEHLCGPAVLYNVRVERLP